MSELFISYSSHDRDIVTTIVEYLEDFGFSTWWDRHITAGKAFDRDIETALEQAKCVVVVWSKHSVESDWVRAEANEGLVRRILVPVLIDDCQPPLLFRRLHTLTLGLGQTDTLENLAHSVERLVPLTGKPKDASAEPGLGKDNSQKLAPDPQPPGETRGIEIESHEPLSATNAEDWNIPPFVGREQTLSQLKDGLQLSQSRQGQVMFLAGEPGIGKSRTAQEFTTLAEKSGAEVFSTWCDETQFAPPYWPWLRIVRSILEDETKTDAFKHLGAGGPVLASILPEIRQTFPDIGEMPEYSPERLTFEITQAICNLLKQSSAKKNVVVFIDDLHCADEQTLQALTALAREIARSSILILGTFRDVEVEKDHRLTECLIDLSRLRHYRRLQLSGLTRDEVQHFLSTNSQHDSDIVDAVVTKTDGNPLYVTEIGRTANLSTKPGRGADSDQLVVPQSLKELILGRLIDLSPKCTSLLNHAAVLGREIDHRLLGASAKLDSQSVDNLLKEASKAGIVCAGPTGALRFTHIIVRDSLYNEIGRSERIATHKQIADIMSEDHSSQRSTGSRFETLAYHYQEAGLAQKAISSWEQASRVAIQRSAYSDAIVRVRQAISLLPDSTLPEEQKDELEIRLRLSLGSALTLLEGAGSKESALEYGRALALCNRYPESALLFNTIAGLWGHHAMLCDKEAFPLVEVMLKIAREHPSRSHELLASNAHAMTQFFEGNYNSSTSILIGATQQMQDAMDLRIASGKTGGWTSPALTSPSYYAWHLALVGQANMAEELAEKTLNQAIHLGTHAHAQALTYLAVVYETTGDFERLRTLSDEIIEIAQENGYAQWLAVAKCTRGWAVASLGNPTSGLIEVKNGRDEYQALGGKLCVTYRNYFLADTLRIAGRVPQAIELIEQTLDSGKERFEHFYDAELIRLRGDCALEQGDTTFAVSHFRKAYELAARQGAKLPEIRGAVRLLQHAPEKKIAQRLHELRDELRKGLGQSDLSAAEAALDKVDL
ncbi:MAG: AAA family ATPase [Pseudomonadales bacterium]|nr:AAA family ATPase [Pseudomonadales bacterium]